MYLKSNQVSPAAHAAVQADVTFVSLEEALEEGWTRNQDALEQDYINRVEAPIERQFAQWLAFPGDR